MVMIRTTVDEVDKTSKGDPCVPQAVFEQQEQNRIERPTQPQHNGELNPVAVSGRH